jgi:hypothetical protein
MSYLYTNACINISFFVACIGNTNVASVVSLTCTFSNFAEPN